MNEKLVRAFLESLKTQNNTQQQNPEIIKRADFAELLNNVLENLRKQNVGQYTKQIPSSEENPFAKLAELIMNGQKEEHECACGRECNEGNEKPAYNKLEDALDPGNIVVYKNTDFIGVILGGGAIMKVRSDGKVLGYIHNYTENAPYEIAAVYEPDDEVFKLNETDDMVIVWKALEEAPKKRMVTKNQIAEMMGIDPDSFEIE